MADDPRIETVARALAQHRLGHSLLTQSLPSELARSILDKSVERLWPSLTEEAEIVLQALDGQQPQPSPEPEVGKIEVTEPEPTGPEPTEVAEPESVEVNQRDTAVKPPSRSDNFDGL